MSCTGYDPVFQEQLDGSPLGSLSCTCYAGAMAGEYDTCGKQTPTGRYVRVLTGDSSGGTTLNQVDQALRKGYGIDLDTRVGSASVDWAYFRAQIIRGRGAILQGGYGPINDSKFQGSETFRGNHAIYVPPEWKAMDPLADGRRPGIYKYHGEVYPEALLRSFASQLVVDPETGRKAGTRVWCSFTRDNTSTWRAKVTPTPGRKYPIYFYSVKVGKYANGITYWTILGRDLKHTAGIDASCTAPMLARPASGVAIPPKSLVRLTSGVHKGVYIQSQFAKEYP